MSKNGNLMLNAPMRADGTIDEKEERILSTTSPTGWALWRGHLRHPPVEALLVEARCATAAASCRKGGRNLPSPRATSATSRAAATCTRWCWAGRTTTSSG
ncbi:hypothetical protein AB5I41_27540 [Sphingomonas sp. MMS24-JH45]